MADKIVTLKDKDDNNVYPLSRGLASNSVDTNAIQDGAVSKVKLAEKKYIFIGDSYNTTDTPPGGVPIVPWSLKVRDAMGLTDGVNCFRSGVSGAGWVHNTPNTFQKQLEALVAQIENVGSITDIVICGGINDMSEQDSDVYNAIASLSNYCATNLPNAIIHVGCISWDKTNNARVYIRRILPYWNASAPSFPNIRCIGGVHTAYHNYSYYQPDGHPNANGSEAIGTYIANYLKGGQSKQTWTGTLTVNGYTSTLISDSDKIFDITNSLDGNSVYVNVKASKSYLSTTVASLQSDIGYKIGEIQGSVQFFWYEDVNEGVIQSGTAYIYDSNSTWTEMQYCLSAYQKDIYLTFKGVTSSGNTVVNNPRRIVLYPNNPNVVNDVLYC